MGPTDFPLAHLRSAFHGLTQKNPGPDQFHSLPVATPVLPHLCSSRKLASPQVLIWSCKFRLLSERSRLVQDLLLSARRKALLLLLPCVSPAFHFILGRR
jgi:hypothetical protein